MGCGQSVEERENKKKNDEIDKALKKEKANLQNEVKMLLLGTNLIISLCVSIQECSTRVSKV